jgi:hypothetical protein
MVQHESSGHTRPMNSDSLQGFLVYVVKVHVEMDHGRRGRRRKGKKPNSFEGEKHLVLQVRV